MMADHGPDYLRYTVMNVVFSVDSKLLPILLRSVAHDMAADIIRTVSDPYMMESRPALRRIYSTTGWLAIDNRNPNF